MALALRAWAINRGGKNSVRNLRYGPRTRLVRGINRAKMYLSRMMSYFLSGLRTWNILPLPSDLQVVFLIIAVKFMVC